MLKNYLLVAIRSLYTNKTQTVLHVAGLSIGMTVTLLILPWVKNERSYDTAYPAASRVYRVTNGHKVSAL